MNNVNNKLQELSLVVENCYVAQKNAFSPVEYPYINRVIKENKIQKVLDVGTGEGNFIHGLATQNPNVSFLAIDVDEMLISSAKNDFARNNLTFKHLHFDSSFRQDNYDFILARFAAEHMKDVPQFIADAYKKLKKGGLFLITEWFVDDFGSRNEIWQQFRKKELELYKKSGSHPRLAINLPKYMSDANFTEISSNLRHIAPSTVGYQNFYSLIIEYAKLYHSVEPEVWNENMKNGLINYALNAMENHPDEEDILLISHTIGKKN